MSMNCVFHGASVQTDAEDPNGGLEISVLPVFIRWWM